MLRLFLVIIVGMWMVACGKKEESQTVTHNNKKIISENTCEATYVTPAGVKVANEQYQAIVTFYEKGGKLTMKPLSGPFVTDSYKDLVFENKRTGQDGNTLLSLTNGAPITNGAEIVVSSISYKVGGSGRLDIQKHPARNDVGANVVYDHFDLGNCIEKK